MADDWKSLQEQFRQIQEHGESGDPGEGTIYYGCHRRVPGDCLGRLLGFGIVAVFLVVPIFYGVYSQTAEHADCRGATQSELRDTAPAQCENVGKSGDSAEHRVEMDQKGTGPKRGQSNFVNALTHAGDGAGGG